MALITKIIRFGVAQLKNTYFSSRRAPARAHFFPLSQSNCTGGASEFPPEVEIPELPPALCLASEKRKRGS